MTSRQPDTHAAPSDQPLSHLRIGNAMGRMRRMIGRRVLSRLVIDALAPDLELSHLDVLSAVKRATDPQEMTVGAIADGMRIDPSRASRIVSDMVARGVLRREASQADARRIVVAPTEWGTKLIAEVEATKRSVIDAIVSDWPEEDVVAFSELFERFVLGFERTVQARENKDGPAATLDAV